MKTEDGHIFPSLHLHYLQMLLVGSCPCLYSVPYTSKAIFHVLKLLLSFFFLTAYIVKLLECSRSALYFLRCSWCFVFAPCTRHMLKIIDNGEFYEQEKPLSLKDLKSLVLILKQVEYCNTIATLCCHEAFTCLRMGVVRFDPLDHRTDP